ASRDRRQAPAIAHVARGKGTSARQVASFCSGKGLETVRDLSWRYNLVDTRDRPGVAERVLQQAVAVTPEHVGGWKILRCAAANGAVERDVRVRYADLEDAGGTTQGRRTGESGVLDAAFAHSWFLLRDADERVPYAQVDVHPHATSARRAVQLDCVEGIAV